MTYLILFAVYLLSALLWWKYINLAYSERGRWGNLTVESDSLCITFIPVINSFFCLYGWLGYYPIKKEYRKRDYNKFFNIKK